MRNNQQDKERFELVFRSVRKRMETLFAQNVISLYSNMSWPLIKFNRITR